MRRACRECPSSGHCSSAATSASCASSSATPTSRTTRVSPAMSFGHSMRNTASIAACVADCVMRQGAQTRDGPDVELDLAEHIGVTLRPVDRPRRASRARGSTKPPTSSFDSANGRRRRVCLPPKLRKPRRARARLERARREQHAGLLHLADQRVHALRLCAARRRRAGLGRRIGLVHRDVASRREPCGLLAEADVPRLGGGPNVELGVADDGRVPRRPVDGLVERAHAHARRSSRRARCRRRTAL